MKRGDVFRINGEEQLYFSDTVTPSGAVFAHKFDLDHGAYGQPVSFPSSTLTEILFNTFEPEQEEGWEYCKVVQKIYPEPGYSDKEWLEAEVEGESGVYSAGKSKVIGVLRGEPVLGYKNEKHEAMLQGLVKTLIKDGWQPVLQRRNQWFDLRFKRKKKSKSVYEQLFGRK